MRDLPTIDGDLAIHLSLRNLLVAFATRYHAIARVLGPWIARENRAIMRLVEEHNRAVDEQSEAESVIFSAIREGRFATMTAQA